MIATVLQATAPQATALQAVALQAVVDTTDRHVIARLGALCFFLSAIEFMIPKPLPFLRIGLANLPLMLAVAILPLRGYAALVLVKLFGQALVGGTLFSWIFLFSLAGTISSATIMYLLKKTLRSHISYVGISVAGAFASNAAQLFIAQQFIFGEGARLVAPPFLLAGIVSGTLLGFFTNHIAATSRWYAQAKAGTLQPQPAPAIIASSKESSSARLLTALTLIIALLFSPSLFLTAGITALSFLLLLISKTRVHPLPAIITAVSILVFNLLVPFGKVLAQPFSFPITQGALLLGIKKALILEGMLFLSRWALAGTKSFPGVRSGILSEMFAFLAVLTSHKNKITRKNLVASIDKIMFERA